jgi:perosamine synthetase
MSIGALLLRFRLKYAHGPRVAYYRDRVRPRILRTSPVRETDDSTCEIHALTSKQDWLNLIWTLKSFYWASGRKYALCIHDDGSLGAEQQDTLRWHFPQARIVGRAEADRRMEAVLKDYPRCRQFRFSNHLAPKVFDFAAYLESERMLLVDSDLLFFAEPTELLARIEDQSYDLNAFNEDDETAYAIDPSAIRLDFELQLRVNSGLAVIQPAAVRWDWIEEFLALPGILSGHFWRIEQTVFALCASRFGVELLPRPYSVRLDRGLNHSPVRHYVGAIRHLMYGEGIRHLVRNGALTQWSFGGSAGRQLFSDNHPGNELPCGLVQSRAGPPAFSPTHSAEDSSMPEPQNDSPSKKITAPGIPVALPDLSELESKYVQDALASGWISSRGKYVDQFEQAFSRLCGVDSAVSVSNGTVALHLALLALEVHPGDEVIVPSLTYVATANAVRYTGAQPVFVDVEPGTWCIDPSKIEHAVTAHTVGIIAVDLYGHPADADAINAVAQSRGLWVVEDAAEAPLATYKGRPAGSLAKIGTFSFYGNKVFTCGEGGAITLDDRGLAACARMLRNQGMDPNRRYFHPVIGYNYRLTNIACAILCAQIERREQILARRHAIYSRYRDLLDGIPGVGFQPVASWAAISPWLFSITIDAQRFGRSRDQVMQCLAQQGIDTRPFFVPLHRLPPYHDGWSNRDTPLPETERLAASGINLPTYPALSDADVCRVVTAIRELSRYRCGGLR